MVVVFKRIARKFRSTFMADKPPGATISDLEMSWDVSKTFQKLKEHEWELMDIQYAIMGLSIGFCIIVIDNPPLIIRLALGALLTIACIVPITSQFFFNAMPIFTWLILFYCCSFIPGTWRPPISVRVLPALETILYGSNLSDVLSSFQASVLDVLAWLPYGLIHFVAPFVVAAVLFLFGPPTLLRNYAFAFGFMNFIGVAIQIFCPAAPPWYKNAHGLEPANYSMPGSPGGLARIDELLGLNMYSNTFGASPMVFGAFPSLHSGCATMEVLFMSYLFPKFSFVFFAYELWIWWSTMYLTHHYFIDLIGGAVLSYTVFNFAKFYYNLPIVQMDKFSRWSYDAVQYYSYSTTSAANLTGNRALLSAYKYRKSADLNHQHAIDEESLYFDDDDVLMDDFELLPLNEEENGASNSNITSINDRAVPPPLSNATLPATRVTINSRSKPALVIEDQLSNSDSPSLSSTTVSSVFDEWHSPSSDDESSLTSPSSSGVVSPQEPTK